MLNELLGDTYRRILVHPVFQSPLTPEEQQRLHVSNYQSHAEHILALSQFIAEKTAAEKTGKDFESRVEERAKALVNQKAGDKLRDSSPSNIPGGRGDRSGDTEGMSSGDLLAEGLREEYAKRQNPDEEP